MDKTKFIWVHGTWLEKGDHQGEYVGEPMTRLCAVLPDNLTEEQEEAAAEWLLYDDRIFFVFYEYEDVIGKHLDFEVHSYEEANYEPSKEYLQ